MKYLLDTNHWSSIQRSHPAVIARVQSLPAEATLYMPVVAQAELLAGVELIEDQHRRDRLRELYELAVAQATEVLPVTSRVAERYAHIFATLRRQGTPIQTNDMWIAAIAQAYDLTLVSNDTDFRFVDGLTVEDWVTRQTGCCYRIQGHILGMLGHPPKFQLLTLPCPNEVAQSGGGGLASVVVEEIVAERAAAPWCGASKAVSMEEGRSALVAGAAGGGAFPLRMARNCARRDRRRRGRRLC